MPSNLASQELAGAANTPLLIVGNKTDKISWPLLRELRSACQQHVLISAHKASSASPYEILEKFKLFFLEVYETKLLNNAYNPSANNTFYPNTGDACSHIHQAGDTEGISAELSYDCVSDPWLKRERAYPLHPVITSGSACITYTVSTYTVYIVLAQFLLQASHSPLP